MTPSRKIGVILCRCRGLIGDRLDLRELRRSLEAEEDLVFLRTAESLCDDPGPLKAKGVDALVVAGCRDATLMERSKTVLEGAPVSPWSCEFVDLKTPLSSSPLDPSASTAYVGLLIRAHMEKVRAAGEAIGGTSSPRRGGILPRAGASMSRRRFLRLPLRIARNAPHPNEVPRIDPDRCLASRISCRECGNACPFQAISFREDRPFLIEGRCEECGLCATLCPSDALRIPSFSDAQALGLLDALADPAADIGGRVLVFTCDRGNDVSGPMVQEAWTRGRAPLFLRLPCLAALSPLLLMRALERGFEEIVPFCPDARCPKRAALPVWERRIRALLERLGSLAPPGSPGPIRFRGEGISQSLSSTGKRIPAAPETEYPADAPPPLTGRARIDLARMISGRFGDTDLREIPLEGAALPYGDIRIDGDRCTLCGACARRCPTGALRLVEEEEIAIQFSHRACLACGACLSHCSEKALSLHRVLQPTPFREGAAVEKVRDEPARCRICGRVTGKKRLQEKVALQLRAAGFDLLADGIGLCRLCKNRAVYQESAEPAERPSVSSST